jgi:hypothetical protein
VSAGGIDLASTDKPVSSVPQIVASPNAVSCPERALNLVVIFAALTPHERQSLAVKMKQMTVDKGEPAYALSSALREGYIG